MAYQAVCQICAAISPLEASKDAVHKWANEHIDQQHATEPYPSIIIEEREP